MKIILKENVDGLGGAGDLVQVKDGYARNFLIPKGLAEEATPAGMARAQEYKRAQQKKMEAAKENAKEIARKIEGIKMEVEMKAGEKGKLFGSVTSSDIAEFLQSKGFDVDKKKIVLEENIKSLGRHKVEIKLYKDVSAQLVVDVKEEEEE